MNNYLSKMQPEKILVGVCIVLASTATACASTLQSEKTDNLYWANYFPDCTEVVSTVSIVQHEKSNTEDAVNLQKDSVAVNIKPSNSTTTVSRIRLLRGKHFKSDTSFSELKIGCLSDTGGLGFILPSAQEKGPAEYIQIDALGRVFHDFNQAGLQIEKFIEPKSSSARN